MLEDAGHDTDDPEPDLESHSLSYWLAAALHAAYAHAAGGDASAGQIR